MKHYYPEDIQMVNFYGRLIPIVQYPEMDERGVIIDNIITQLGLSPFREELLERAIYDLKFLATIIVVNDGAIEQELVVLPLSKLNAWLFSIRLDRRDELWFNQEVITADGEILEERVNLLENLAKYQGECTAALHSYWMQGIAINPNAQSQFAPLGSMWRVARQNLDRALTQFVDYGERVGEPYSKKKLKVGLNQLLMEFFPTALVLKPEESMNGYDLYRLALAEDFIARYLGEAIISEMSPAHCITMLDSELITAFHKIAEGLLEGVQLWSVPGVR